MLRKQSRLFKALDGGGERDLVMCSAGAEDKHCKWIQVRTFMHRGKLCRSIGFSTWPQPRRSWKPFVHIGEFAR